MTSLIWLIAMSFPLKGRRSATIVVLSALGRLMHFFGCCGEKVWRKGVRTGSVENLNHGPCVHALTMCEQTQQAQQISFSGGTPCLGRRQRCFATVRAQIQSQDLHTTPAFRQSGSQGVLQDRLPPGGSAARLRRAPLAPWTEGGASLYDLSEGQPQTLEGDSSTQAVQHHRSSIPGTSSAAQAGRAGLDWLGMRSPESLLCAAPSRPRKTMENRGLQPLRQARSGLRLRQPTDGG